MTDLVRELMLETRWGNLDRVKELLAIPELDVNAAIDGRRAVADAIQASDIGFLEAYLDTGKVDLSLWVASFESLKDRDAKPFECFSIKCMKAQKKKRVDTTISALMFAIECGDPAKFKMLLDYGANPLEISVKSQESVLSRVCSHGNLDMLKEMLARRARWNFTEKNCFGNSALKALITRKKKPNSWRFFFYDVCNESITKRIGEDEYLSMLKCVLQTTRQTATMFYSADLVKLVIEAVEDEKCMMTRQLAEQLFDAVPKNEMCCFTAESLILVASKGLVEVTKHLKQKGAPVNAADAHGKTAFVYLLEKIGNYVEIEDFGLDADFTSYLLTSNCRNIRIIREWITRKPEMRHLFDEHYCQVGCEKMLELFEGEYSGELVAACDDYIFPLLQNEVFVSELLAMILKNPQVNFKAFIEKLIAAKENGLLRSWINRAESLLQIAIGNKNTDAASFLIDAWHVDVTAKFEGKVPLYLAAEKSDCKTLQRLLAVAMPNRFDKAELALHLRHSPCNCIEKFADSFDFAKGTTKEKAIDKLTELVNKPTPPKPSTRLTITTRQSIVGDQVRVYTTISRQYNGWEQLEPMIRDHGDAFLARSQAAEQTGQSIVVDQAKVYAILSGQDNGWKQLKPMIRDHGDAFLDVCFKQSADGVAPIDAAKKNKFRLIKLFASLAKYAKANDFECFVSNFEARFPGVFDKFITRFGAYLITSSRNFLVTHLLMCKYKIPVDARVHSFQGNYSFPARVLKRGFSSFNAVFLTNFDFKLSQLNNGNQSFRKSFKLTAKHQPNLALLKRFKGVSQHDLLAILIAVFKVWGSINNELLEGLDLSIIAKNIKLMPGGAVKPFTLLALKGGIDPLLKNGKETWLTHYFHVPYYPGDCTSLSVAGVTGYQLSKLTDSLGKNYFSSSNTSILSAAFPNIQEYFKCKVEPFSLALSSKVVSDAQSCMICRCEYEAGDPVLLLSCKHMFHFECLLPLKEKGRWDICPYCNRKSSWYSNS